MLKLIKEYIASPADYEQKLRQNLGKSVDIEGMILRIRRHSWGIFLVISLPRFCIQCVAASVNLKFDLNSLQEGDFVSLSGKPVPAKINDITIWPRDIEIQVSSIHFIQKATEPFPIDISKKVLNLNLDTKLDYRPISLRHPLERAIFKISEGVCRGFRDSLLERGFTEIHTPKIVFSGTEGGANIFQIIYFDRKAFLAQSPQFYKQMGVGIFGRVFEIGPVFRAEKHQTSRHVNEYTSLDFEMGPISSQEDVMGTEIRVLKDIIGLLKKEYSLELKMLDAQLLEVPKQIPYITLSEAHQIVLSRLDKNYCGETDLDPLEERELCLWAHEKHNSEFLFVGHFPSSKRPFYAMDDPNNPELALSFDLLFRGVEITTGGQRIHNYKEQVKKLRRFGLNPEDFSSYLMIHKYGIPPHGGLAIGLERFVSRILCLENIREATMFPRDIKRLTP